MKERKAEVQKHKALAELENEIRRLEVSTRSAAAAECCGILLYIVALPGLFCGSHRITTAVRRWFKSEPGSSFFIGRLNPNQLRAGVLCVQQK